MQPADGDSIGRNAAFALASQLATAGFTAALTLYLVRALGPAGYGLFAVAVGFGTVMLLPADFGISQSAARFIAERRGFSEKVAGVLWDALRIKLAATALMAGVLIALADPIASAYGQPDLAWPLRAVSLAVFGQSVMQLFSGAFYALGRVSVNLRLVFSESLVEASATVLLVVLFGGATAATMGRAVGYLAGGLLGAALALRLIGPATFRRRAPSPGVRRMAKYATALLVIDGAFALFSQLDILLVGALLGAGAAGIYGAPIKLTTLLHYPGYSLAAAVAPRMARHPGVPPDTRALESAMRYLIMLQMGLAVAVLVWADPFVAVLLGGEYGESASVLRALAPFVFLKGFGPLFTLAVNYFGEARRRIPVAVGSLLLNLVLAIILIQEIGVVGAAISVDVSYGAYVLAHLLICRRLLGMSLRSAGPTLARSLLAAIVMAAVLLLIGTSGLGVLALVAGGAAALASFFATLILVGETSFDELMSIPRRISRELLRGRHAGVGQHEPGAEPHS